MKLLNLNQITFCLLLSAFLVTPLMALQRDRQAAMDVQSDQLETLMDKGIAELTGHVLITQGSLRIEADKAVLHQNKQHQVETAELSGQYATVTQTLDDGGTFYAHAKNITYDLSKGTIILKGDALIRQPQGNLQGDSLEYQLNSGKLTASGGETGLGVHLHIPASTQPEQEQ